MNIYNAVRIAASPSARGMGVLVCLNDEIHAAREVTKTSTARLHTTSLGAMAMRHVRAMKEAVASGVKVVISSRAGSGRTFGPSKIVDAGFIRADNLNPQKARILLALALTTTQDSDEIQRIFEQY